METSNSLSKNGNGYVCDLCKKSFKQKIDYTRHTSKKLPCIPLKEIEKRSEEKIKASDEKNKLIYVFKNCLNILRDNEGLTGEKALRNMSYMLTLKLIEPRLKDEINIENYPYDFDSFFEEDVLEHNKRRLFSIIHFSNLAKEKEENIPLMMKYAWNIILSVHPTTKHIFLHGKGFDIKYQTTYKKLIDKFNSVDLCSSEYDVLGNAYEEVIQDIMTGKVLGQFFTQPLVKKMMVKLINPMVYEDGTCETCCDPTMGTGGFLISYLKDVLHKFSTRGISPNWEFLKDRGIYGKELEPDTYQLAASNMLISSGHMFEKLDQGDSIREPIPYKFDCILSNPPFGIKGLRYDDFSSPIKAEYTPIKSDNAVSLFLQAIIHMLNINGRCAVVLPDGQDLFSKSNKTLIGIREYLLKTCDLKEVIYLPSGIFNYTSIKTCIFYFIKKKEGKDILAVKHIRSKTTGKITGREYTFSKTYQTKKVSFYDGNPYEDVKNLLVEVDMEDIAKNEYSLNYSEYILKEEKVRDDKIEMRRLGELFTFLPKSKRPASYGKKEGDYPFFTSSQVCEKFCDDFDYNKESLIIGDGGEPNVNYSSKFSASDHCYILQENTEESFSIKYVYYFLLNNLESLRPLYKGLGIKNISKHSISDFEIPIPSLEKQHSLVKSLDFIYENIIGENEKKIGRNKEWMKILFQQEQENGVCTNTFTLGEICTFLPKSKRQASYGKKEGTHPFFTSSQSCDKFCDECDYEEESIVIGTGGNANIKYGKKFSCSADNFVLCSTHPSVCIKYLYYFFLSNLSVLENGFCGLGIKHISKEYIKNISIHIPSNSRQKQIVEECDKIEEMIQKLQDEITRAKKMAEDFVKSVTTIRENPSEEEKETLLLREKRRGKKKE